MADASGKRGLSEMTLEELWALFPIVLTEHKACWGDWYREEAERLSRQLNVEGLKLHHIGSTAINGIWAKPIVDILMEIPPDISMDGVKESLVKNGYLCMCEKENRKSFNRGYTENGFAERVFHLHLRFYGDNDEIYFRDYMNGHPALAKEYEALKLSLWKQYQYDRDAYTAKKGSFVKKYTSLSKRAGME